MTLLQKQPLKFVQFLPGIIWFILVLIGICLPGSDVPTTTWLDKIYFDKIAHIVLFGGLVFLFCMPFKKSDLSIQAKTNYFIKILLATIVWGITTEFIQKFFVPSRAFDLLDWLADSVGATIAFFVCKKYFL